MPRLFWAVLFTVLTVDGTQLACAARSGAACEPLKFKATGRKTFDVLNAYGADLRAPNAKKLARDLARAEARFTSLFNHAEAGKACLHPHDGEEIDGAVEDFVVQARCAMGPVCRLASTYPAGVPALVEGKTVQLSQQCGEVRDAAGAVLGELGCNSLYAGGGGANIPPVTLPAGIEFQLKLACCSGGSVVFTGSTVAETGSTRTCTTAGCLLGPPVPFVHPTLSAFSACIVSSFGDSIHGFGDLDTDEGSLTFPLTARISPTGDLLDGSAPDRPDVPGVQPCPLCLGPAGSASCAGGPNHGHPCTPASTDSPTSADCQPPPPPAGLDTPITLRLRVREGEVTRSASNDGMFCGYCRDGNGNYEKPARACDTDAECTAPFSQCAQRSPGAFGFPTARQIVWLEKPETQSTVICLAPTFTVFDAVLDLPGPLGFSATAEFQNEY